MQEAAKTGGSRQSSGSTFDRATDAARQALGNGVAGARDAADRLRSSAADAVESSVATGKEAAKNTADKLGETAWHVQRAVDDGAKAVEIISADLKDRSLKDLLGTLSGIGQRQPVALLGCGMVVGFLLAKSISYSARR